MSSMIEFAKATIASYAVSSETDPVFTEWKASSSLEAGSSASAASNGTAVGANATVRAEKATALGYKAKVAKVGAMQLGAGTNDH